jgi:RimJ/RimL family protein N-acetyltransferase
LNTARLVGERLRPEDLALLRLLYQDPRVMATLAADGRPLAKQAIQLALDANLAHWQRYGFGVWMFRCVADGRFVGYCGLKHTSVVSADEVSMLYAVAAEDWGSGFATEMAAAVAAAGFGRLGLAEIVAFTLPSNLGSRRVMERVGFTYEREIVHASLPHVLYRLRRAG